MPSFTCVDSSAVGYRERGSGPLVVAIPGGPLRDASYLDELGGLPDAGYRLVTLELPGTGATPAPADPSGFSAVAIANLLEELRAHLGVDRITLVAHSAGAGAAYLFAQQHPGRVERLVLITPAHRCLGLEDTEEEFEHQLAKRAHEPWFGAARSAMDQMEADGPTPELRSAIKPLLYGRWDDLARAHPGSRRAQGAGAREYWRHMPQREELATAMGHLTAPVHLLIGELDMAPGPELATRICDLFPDAGFVQLPGCGHFPWVDDRDAFRRVLVEGLRS